MRKLGFEEREGTLAEIDQQRVEELAKEPPRVLPAQGAAGAGGEDARQVVIQQSLMGSCSDEPPRDR